MPTRENSAQVDICRICRAEGQDGHPLSHPCICTGSIKWIHEDCLMQWMRYSGKTQCELCGYQYLFAPVYSPETPRLLPIRDVAAGIRRSLATNLTTSMHYGLVAFAWLVMVPLCINSTFLWMSNFSFGILLLPEFLSNNSIATDLLRGFLVMACVVLLFTLLLWLRDQILIDGGPDWLDRNEENPGPNNINMNNVENIEFLVEPENWEDIENIEDIAFRIEEVGWNPMEWDRVEDITLERFLGFDGSMVFLQHALWVIALNSLFLLTVAFYPHIIGSAVIIVIGVTPPDDPILHGITTTFLGYLNIGLMLAILHSLAKVFRQRKLEWFLGLTYLVVKVVVIASIENGVIPLIVGLWLDFCSLPILDGTVTDRVTSFHYSPRLFLVTHWMFGITFISYFGIFISLLRIILRPGVLSFLNHINDPGFNSIQEMAHLSILRYKRKIIGCTITYIAAIVMTVRLPANILKIIWPAVSPHKFSFDSTLIVLFLLVLLQILLLDYFRHSRVRNWFRAILQFWSNVLSSLLGIRSYLIRAELQEIRTRDQNLRAGHQDRLQENIPKFFALRLAVFMTLICTSVVISILLIIASPLWILRHVLLILSTTPELFTQIATAHETPTNFINVLYTFARGICLFWTISKLIIVTISLVFHIELEDLQRVFRHWLVLRSDNIIAGALYVVLLAIIPLLFGLLIELTVLIPLQVPLEEVPIHFLGQDWLFGLIYTKITCALIMLGPDWKLKLTIQMAYQHGFLNVSWKFILLELGLPVISFLALALILPYTTAKSIMPLFIENQETIFLIERRIYPFLLLGAVITTIIYFVFRHFKNVYTEIKNERYLIGHRLMNYYH